MNAEEFAHKLQKPTLKNGKWWACCPAHYDNNPSLCISDGRKAIVFKCFSAGCTQEDIIEALMHQGIWPGKPKNESFRKNGAPYKSKPKPTIESTPRKIIKTYDYEDPAGNFVYQKVRYEPKDFRIRRPDPDKKGKWIWSIKGIQKYPYRLTKLLASKKSICIVEGEKDVESLEKLGITATTFGGANDWESGFAEYFKDRDVLIFPDNDEAGKSHINDIADDLDGVAKSIKIIFLDGLKEKGDVTDWIQAGGTRAKLAEIVKQAPILGTAIEATPIEQPKSSIPEQLEQIGFIDWPHQKKNGAPKGTIQNLRKLLEVYKIYCRYNVIAKEIEVNIPGSQFTIDNKRSCSIFEVKSLCEQHNLPTKFVEDYMRNIADTNSYNPAADWITSKPWDGDEERFIQLVLSTGSDNMALCKILLWRWMLSAVAAIYEPEGISAQGVFVMQGAQGIGKTSWFWSLMPNHRDFGIEGVTLDPSNRDSVKIAVSKWLVELGELDATFKKADIEALKAFITKSEDDLFLRYARSVSTYPRRTVYFGSVNLDTFLYDDTGNRRFWVVRCSDQLNARHGLDMQQVWAHVYQAYLDGEPWVPTREEWGKINESNKQFEVNTPFYELILSNYDDSNTIKTPRQAADICRELGYNQPTNIHVRQCAAALRKIYGEGRRTNGKKVWDLPEKKL